MRNATYALIGTFLLALTGSMSATTTCQQQTVGGSGVQYECANATPSTFNFSNGNSPDTMCSISGDFYKSTGAYGYGSAEWSSVSYDDIYYNWGYFDISLTLDLVNSHSSNLNRLSITVYNDTDSTYEVIDTIYGGGGDICSQTLHYYLYRPGWRDKSLRLYVQSNFWNSDTIFKMNSVSFLQHH